MFVWDFYIARLDSSSCVYTNTDDLSDGLCVLTNHSSLV